MEDVKELIFSLKPRASILECFNPCFNGRCKRTDEYGVRDLAVDGVSILVLMEDVKEPWDFQKWVWRLIDVSILVLMEDVKEQELGILLDQFGKGFNPCFNGRCKRTVKNVLQTKSYTASFNPCFNGRCKRTYSA